ncbi:MAG: hypothetical protein KQH63_08435 [Desulfobulbaceae bacterium]|nr:hypothetical protein [Desulfobulbaceae bacterium]MCB2182040.1 hypothetical protein [Desulfobulbaceae bacterium]
MSALIHLLADHHRKNENKSIVGKLAKTMSRLSEAFWFVLSLVLFLVMGPFSIIAVVAGLYHLSTNAKDQKSPEPVGC